MNRASVAEVRAEIATRILGPPARETLLGAIRLHEHQVSAAERLQRMLDEHGGALLADDVGLGKTYAALMVARNAADVLVIAPAALRDTWRRAASAAGVPVRFASMEQLSRGRITPCHPGLVVVDEAHHLRNPGTRRFGMVAQLCKRTRVLLLSATPVQNRVSDLRVLLSLFLGERAAGIPEVELARHVVRRVHQDLRNASSLTLPAVLPPRWLATVEDEDCLDRIMSLPPPLPPSDGEDGGALLTYTLVRQWASSRAALEAALRRRLARGRAMEDAIAAGRMPARHELAAWCYSEGAQQLSFPELTVASACEDAATLLEQVRTHNDGVRDLLAWLHASTDPDDRRAAALGDLLRAHSGERMVAFAEYVETVTMLFRCMRSEARVALLTHGGARVAGGPMTRRELLDRFALPDTRIPESERITLLLTTDVLSEGVNLQSASVAVHLDLVWNPARLTQRVGRLRRLGAARDVVSVYAFAPPAPAERLLRMEERLRVKVTAAARAVGVAGAIIPGLPSTDSQGSASGREERIAAVLQSWRRACRRSGGPVPIAAASSVGARQAGAIACVDRAGEALLVAVRGETVTDARDVVEGMLEDASGGSDAALRQDRLDDATSRIARWLQRQEARGVVELASLRVARSRRAILRRVESIANRTARHERPRLASLMRTARATASATLPAGAERVLDQLAEADLRDDAWLRAMSEFASLHARPRAERAAIIAVLVLQPDGG